MVTPLELRPMTADRDITQNKQVKWSSRAAAADQSNKKWQESKKVLKASWAVHARGFDNGVHEKSNLEYCVLGLKKSPGKWVLKNVLRIRKITYTGL